jgi:hypothetical protein
MNRLCLLTAVAAAVALAAVGFVRGSYAAGGSDSSCYALMAEAFASGKLQPTSALASQVPWPDASKTFAPGGFVPSQSDPTASAPVCAPGFSLLLAPVVKIGGQNAFFAVTPMAGAWLVWLTFLAGRALAGPLAGAMAAVLVASSPAVLYQVVQPMNDVMTAALWMAVFVALISRQWGLAGACCGLALLVRPNLLPLAAVAGIYAWTAGPIGPALRTAIPDPRSPIPDRMKRAALFGVAALPCVLVILWLNAALYGGPLRSGYGQLGHLFSLAVFPGNASRYGRWLIETQTPFPWLAVFAPFLVDRDKRAGAWLAVGLVGVTAAIYFAYTPFDDWSYLRFLMPALALLLVLASVCVVTIAANVGGRIGLLVVATVTVALAMFSVRAANDRLAFRMQALEQRYRSAGIIVRDRLPSDAVLLTVWDSGAVRFHGRKEAVVWEGLDPAWLDRGLDWLAAHGHAPYILLESWEEPGFRERFAGSSPIGNLDWPPKYEVDRVVRIYDPADRARYLRGERVVTEYLWPLKH